MGSSSIAATILLTSILLVLSSCLPSPASSLKVPTNIKQWCKLTPYPKQCEYSMGNLPPSSLPRRLSEFHKTEVEIAVDRALRAARYAATLRSRCRNNEERTALADCLELYQDTVAKLNKTIDPSINCSKEDAQTWLSAALTNLETCRTGFVELGVTDLVMPLLTNNNVSNLISNTLATNNVTNPFPAEFDNGFPSWLKPGDRKLLQSSPSPASQANIVVASDGSGNVRTIQAALDAASSRSGSGRYIIYVKKGTYNENLVLGGSKLRNIMLVGDGMRSTIITGDRSVGGGSTTFDSATVAVTADGFIAQGITFRNTAGPANNQAVALRCGADLAVFFRCGFEGYQDTLYVFSQRQFYRECYIYGTVDFIFGNAAVVLQNCMIYGRRPGANQKLAVTAQGRTDPNQNTGIVVHNSRVMAGSDLQPVVGSFRTFLGRPWKLYSRTVFMQCFLDSLVDPEGWLEWDGNFALDTLFYGEYRNMGPGSSTANRVKWKGYKVITSQSEASTYTVGSFLSGSSWIQQAGVPVTSGL